MQQAVVAWFLRPWGIPFAWLAVTFTVAGLAYFLGRPAWMGKRLNGTFSSVRAVVMFPYLLLAVVASFVRRLSSEPAWNEVAPNIFVGRRISGAALPPNTTAVVDLTCEFAEPADVRAGRVYRCLPTLDGCASDPTAFAALAREVAAWEHRTYIHCAVGHGRSAAMAAAVMVLRGQAKDADDAEAIMRRARPGIELKPAQKRLLDGLSA